MIIKRDVIIVGAGISGSICAAYLANSGVDVLLIDKEIFPRDKACGDLLTEGVVTHISRLNAFEELDKIGTCLRRAHLMGENGSECIIPFEGYVAPRFELDSMLVQVAIRRGTEFRDGCRVRSLIVENSENGPAVRGVNVRERGVDYQIYARQVILADGAESLLTPELMAQPQEVEQRFTRSGYYAGERAYFTGVNLDEYLAKGRYNAYGIFGFHRKLVNGYYWIVPSGETGVSEGYCNIGIVYDPESSGQVTAEEIFADLIESNRRVAALMLGAQQATPWKQGTLRDVNTAGLRYDQGFLVIGDGAGAMMPLFKDGMTAAADTAEAAAIAINSAMRTNDFSQIEKVYEDLITPDEKRLKMEKITVESMYDPEVPMNMIARMTNNPTYVKRVLKDIF
ncbi:MAG: NAD(P)/FAD-dependent oxidoreductase [Eubacterium sp.]|nr:NAD(P)/FAD-dependent oxidoreductase [Candidatus Colimonas fimequi]